MNNCHTCKHNRRRAGRHGAGREDVRIREDVVRAAILLRDECAGCYHTSIICADAAMVGNGGAEAVRTAFEMYGYALACTSCLPDDLRADMVESDIRRDAGITMLELTRFLQSLFGKAK